LIGGPGKLPISIADFIARFPNLYHMAEPNSWPSIRKYGLLSTTALLDLFEIRGQLRNALESQHRAHSVAITHPKYGTAVIRDQKPLREIPLAKCLIDITPTQWYRILNGYVFFWVTQQRLNTLLSARAYRGKIHTVITVDSARLFETNSKCVRLSPINSGSTIYNPRPRGVDTFQPLSTYSFEERRRMRGLANAIAELAVRHSVLDISKCVLAVGHYRNGKLIERLRS
jgi:hypothetical protein